MASEVLQYLLMDGIFSKIWEVVYAYLTIKCECLYVRPAKTKSIFYIEIFDKLKTNTKMPYAAVLRS